VSHTLTNIEYRCRRTAICHLQSSLQSCKRVVKLGSPIRTPIEWLGPNRLLEAALPVLHRCCVPVITFKHLVASMRRPGLPQSLQLSASLALFLVFCCCSIFPTRSSQVMIVQRAALLSAWREPSASSYKELDMPSN